MLRVEVNVIDDTGTVLDPGVVPVADLIGLARTRPPDCGHWPDLVCRCVGGHVGDVLVSVSRALAGLQALQAAVVCAVDEDLAAGPYGRDSAGEAVAVELGTSTLSGRGLVERSRTLCAHPPIWSAHATGRLDASKARTIAEALDAIPYLSPDPDDPDHLEYQARYQHLQNTGLAYALDHTNRQLKLHLARLLTAGDTPETTRRRRHRALAERGVWIDHRHNGTAELAALLSTEDAEKVYTAVRALGWAHRTHHNTHCPDNTDPDSTSTGRAPGTGTDTDTDTGTDPGSGTGTGVRGGPLGPWLADALVDLILGPRPCPHTTETDTETESETADNPNTTNSTSASGTGTGSSAASTSDDTGSSHGPANHGPNHGPGHGSGHGPAHSAHPPGTCTPPRATVTTEIQIVIPIDTLAGLSEQPALINGRATIPADIARHLAGTDTRWRAILTHQPTGTLLDIATTTYRPPATLTRHVRLRDGTCRFPGCATPAHQCDLDHLIPFPQGPTTAENLHALCRRHHRIKHEHGWTVTKGPNNTLTWTSPLGTHTTTHPTHNHKTPT